jgi:hypothetical protein
LIQQKQEAGNRAGGDCLSEAQRGRKSWAFCAQHSGWAPKDEAANSSNVKQDRAAWSLQKAKPAKSDTRARARVASDA